MKIERYDLTALTFILSLCSLIGALQYRHTKVGVTLMVLTFALAWLTIDEIQLQKAKEDIKKLEGIYK